MPTTLHLARHSKTYRVDDLATDVELVAESERLRPWLAQHPLETITAGQLHAFVMTTYPLAVLERLTVWYEKVYDPESGFWFWVCHDQSTIRYPPNGSVSPMQLTFARTAKY